MSVVADVHARILADLSSVEHSQALGNICETEGAFQVDEHTSSAASAFPSHIAMEAQATTEPQHTQLSISAFSAPDVSAMALSSVPGGASQLFAVSDDNDIALPVSPVDLAFGESDLDSPSLSPLPSDDMHALAMARLDLAEAAADAVLQLDLEPLSLALDRDPMALQFPDDF